MLCYLLWWSQSQLTLGKRQGRPWIKPPIYSTQRDTQPFTFTALFTPTSNLEPPFNLTACLWTVRGNRSTQRKECEKIHTGNSLFSIKKQKRFHRYIVITNENFSVSNSLTTITKLFFEYTGLLVTHYVVFQTKFHWLSICSSLTPVSNGSQHI